MGNLNRVGRARAEAADLLRHGAKMFFGIIRIIVRLAPVGAFGAMAFTVGAHGPGSLLSLACPDRRVPFSSILRTGPVPTR